MQKHLKRILKLIHKTGDKYIVTDSETDDSYVILALNDYEKLITDKSAINGLTEDELLDKINRDIAVWKNEQKNGNKFDKFTGFANMPNRRSASGGKESAETTEQPATERPKEENRADSVPAQGFTHIKEIMPNLEITAERFESEEDVFEEEPQE